MTIYENIAERAGIPLEDVNEFIDLESAERSWSYSDHLDKITIRNIKEDKAMKEIRLTGELRQDRQALAWLYGIYTF